MSLILLVDDDEDMMAITSRWFKKAGYDVQTANSGKSAIESLKSIQPDLIILDYAMPEMDGPATFEALKADDATAKIPVLFRTGIEDANSSEVLANLDPTGVVSKGDGKPKLLKAVAEILA